ncbi:unnamed protein product [Peronospora farinosa]|uniref:Uncharacterized protein n=1 Tax=Peronospora farinosa TaxID=134698 RepID=A0AAV0UQA5_9STRA|nr:unnamed protein product [Peronospora farinosa]
MLSTKILLPNLQRLKKLETFAGPSDVGVPIHAVQFSLYKMDEAVLERCLYNIYPHGEVFLPTDDPHGIISSTIVRSTSKW